jgi:uncharacterized protein YprB with RNaseH-like and TPR domain
VLFPARIITAAFKWQDSVEVHALHWEAGKEQFQESDEKLIRELIPEMSKADEIVAHYGDKFDIPWIRGRALKHGIVMPILKTVDTCAWSRKLFRLSSNKLDFIGEYLGLGGKIRTSYDLWKDVTFHGDKDALEKMITYNQRDVELLEKVYHRLSLYGADKSHAGVMEGKDKWTCVRCGSESVRHVRRMVSAAGTIKHQMRCKSKDCGKYYMINSNSHTEWAGK